MGPARLGLAKAPDAWHVREVSVSRIISHDQAGSNDIRYSQKEEEKKEVKSSLVPASLRSKGKGKVPPGCLLAEPVT